MEHLKTAAELLKGRVSEKSIIIGKEFLKAVLLLMDRNGDGKRLGNIFRSLYRCESKPEFSVKYQLKVYKLNIKIFFTHKNANYLQH